MNYIHQLQNRINELEAIARAFNIGIGELRKYLNSSKFDLDTTVQVSDVLRRLSEVSAFVDEAQDAANRLSMERMKQLEGEIK